MLYSYNKKTYNLPSPLAQSERHAIVLDKILKKYNTNINIMSNVVFLPDVKIKNKVLPKNFYRADTFIDHMIKGFIRSPLKMLSTLGKVLTNTIPSTQNLENIGNILLSEHKPVIFDYDKKYRIKIVKDKNIKDENIEKEKDKDKDKFSNDKKINEKNLNKFKNIENAPKYKEHEMLSFSCVKCNTKQRKSLSKLTNIEIFCKNCGN